MNLQELMTAGYSLHSTSLTYQVYRQGNSYWIYDIELDSSITYTQDIDKLNVYVRIKEMSKMIDKLVLQHGLDL